MVLYAKSVIMVLYAQFAHTKCNHGAVCFKLSLTVTVLYAKSVIMVLYAQFAHT